MMNNRFAQKVKDDVVVINKGKLTITDFQTADHEVVEYFDKQKPELREDRLVSALRTGVMALKSTEISERVDYVEKKFQNLNHKFVNTMSQTIQETESMYEENFGEKGKFREIMAEHFGEDGILLKEILDPNREGSPFYKLKSEVQSAISNLRQDLGIKEKEDEIKNRTTLKGADFEDLCQDLLESFAKIFGDIIENTTSMTGKVKRSKKGDFVLTLADSSRKITFETKDVGSISANEIRKILDEAIENREASYGVLVAKSVEAVPKSIGWFQEIGNDKLVVALGSNSEGSFHDELLLIAYKLARAKVNSQSLKEKQVDTEFIETKIEAIKQKIQKFRTIKTECNNIVKASNCIKTTSEALAKEIGMELDDMNKSLEIKNES